MMKTIVTAFCLSVLMCSAAHAQVSGSHYLFPWKTDSAESEAKALLATEDLLDEICRGGSQNNSDVTGYSCQARQALGAALDTIGWCYGKNGQGGPRCAGINAPRTRSTLMHQTCMRTIICQRSDGPRLNTPGG